MSLSLTRFHRFSFSKDYWVAVLFWYLSYLHFVMHARALAQGRTGATARACCWCCNGERRGGGEVEAESAGEGKNEDEDKDIDKGGHEAKVEKEDPSFLTI